MPDFGIDDVQVRNRQGHPRVDFLGAPHENVVVTCKGSGYSSIVFDKGNDWLALLLGWSRQRSNSCHQEHGNMASLILSSLSRRIQNSYL